MHALAEVLDVPMLYFLTNGNNQPPQTSTEEKLSNSVDYTELWSHI